MLRGGLTPKHVDVAQLLAVLDFCPVSSPRLLPEQVDGNLVSYRPASVASGRGVDFQLLALRGATTVELDSPAIALCTAGSFSLTSGHDRLNVSQGSAVFMDRSGTLDVYGAGQLYIALGTRTLPSAGPAGP